MRIALAIVVLLLNGCALMSPHRSYVPGSLSNVEVRQLADSMAGYMRDTMPAAKTTLVVQMPAFAALRDPLAPELTYSLRVAGFAVVEPGTGVAPITGARYLTYNVAAWDDGVSLRMQLDSLVISRWYTRNGGMLSPASPFSVREVASNAQ